MTREEAIAIIRKEYLCVDRDCDIERSCGKCDLMIPSKEPILEAYKVAIEALAQEPCGDAISRQALLDAIDNERKSLLDMGMKGAEHIVVHHARRIIEEMPSVTPAERVEYGTDGNAYKMSISNGKEYETERIGHWIDREVYDADRWKCSKCGRTEQYQENYCPHCGAKMVEPQERSDKE